MNIQRTFILAMLLLASFRPQLNAQQTVDTMQLFTSLKQLQTVLLAQPVSFSIRYTYASENRPNILLDSLSGSLELFGNSGRYTVDDMVSVSNSRYNITVFPEDKLIYVSRPSTIMKADPVEQLKTMISASGIKNYNVQKSREENTIAVSFSDGGACKEMRIRIDPQTGYMRNVIYVLKTSMLLEASEPDENMIDTYGEYAIVRMDFLNYRKLAAGDTARFNESIYFYIEGDEFKPAPAYKDYQIFKGSPNL